MHILYWILGINLVMVVVGLLVQYLATEFLVYGDEEPMSIWLWLHEERDRVTEDFAVISAICFFFIGPIVLLRALLHFIHCLGERARYQDQFGYDSLDDTQELPQGFQNT